MKPAIKIYKKHRKTLICTLATFAILTIIEKGYLNFDNCSYMLGALTIFILLYINKVID